MNEEIKDMKNARLVAGSLLTGFGILSQVLVEWLITVEAADFSLLTMGLVWMMIILGSGMIAAEFWKGRN